MRGIKWAQRVSLIGLIVAAVVGDNTGAAALFVCYNVWCAAEVIIRERSA